MVWVIVAFGSRIIFVGDGVVVVGNGVSVKEGVPVLRDVVIMLFGDTVLGVGVLFSSS